MKNVLLGLLLMCMGSVFAAPEVTLRCNLFEQSNAGQSEKEILGVTTLGENGQHSYAFKPKFSLDNQALYILSLSLGEEYTDSTNEVVGADYFLSLSRLQDRSKSNRKQKISGQLQSVVEIVSKDNFDPIVSYANKRGRTINKKPKAISLDYRLSGGKKVKLSCKIISIR